MLNFQICFGLFKNSSEVCLIKTEENEFNYLQYVSYDVEISAEDIYCIILNF